MGNGIKMTIVGIIYAIVVMAAIASVNSFASEKLDIYAGGFSHHIAKTENTMDFNEVHNVIGLEYEGVGLLFFKNSYSNNSVALSYHYTHPLTEWLEMGLRGGVVSGYSDSQVFTIGGVAPFLQPTATVFIGDFGAEFGFLPQFTEYYSGVATLTFKWRFE